MNTCWCVGGEAGGWFRGGFLAGGADRLRLRAGEEEDEEDRKWLVRL